MDIEAQNPIHKGIRSRLSAGAIAHFGASLLVRALSILTIVVLGRLLTPSDFGIFAYAVFIATLVEACFMRHFYFSLIRLPEVTKAHLDTLFTLRLLTGSAVAAGILMSAGLVARLVGAPELYAVMIWIGIAQVIAALLSPRFALLEKNLNFGFAAFQVVLVRVLTTCSAIILGFVWGNYWALVTGLILMPIIILVHSYAVAPYRPQLGLSKWRDFFGFGLWVMFATLFNFLLTRFDRLIIGPYLGVAAVGVYRMGVDMAELGSQQLSQPMERVIFPGLSAKSRDKDSLTRAYIETQSVFLGIVLPMGLLTALSAAELLRIVAGAQWLDAMPVIWVLAPLIALNALEGGVRALLYVNDAPQKLFFRNLLLFGLTVPLVFAGVIWGGFWGVILTAAVVKVITLILTLFLASTETDAPFFIPFVRAWRSVVAGALMCATVLGATAAMGPTDATTTVAAAALVLVLKVGLGTAIYLGMHFLLWALSGRPQGLESFCLEQVRRATS